MQETPKQDIVSRCWGGPAGRQREICPGDYIAQCRSKQGEGSPEGVLQWFLILWIWNGGEGGRWRAGGGEGSRSSFEPHCCATDIKTFMVLDVNASASEGFFFFVCVCAVSYTHLTLPTIRCV